MEVVEAMTIIEEVSVQLERARAVYEEVSEGYFTSREDRDVLPFYAEHILLLLHAADHLIVETLPELKKTVLGLQEIARNSGTATIPWSGVSE